MIPFTLESFYGNGYNDKRDDFYKEENNRVKYGENHSLGFSPTLKSASQRSHEEFSVDSRRTDKKDTFFTTSKLHAKR